MMVITIPGMNPPAKRAPMDSFASVPYRIRMMLGGIRMDKAPEKATMAPDIPWSYCLRSISGSDRRPTVAVPAVLAPQTAPKMAPKTVLVIPSPPGMPRRNRSATS